MRSVPVVNPHEYPELGGLDVLVTLRMARTFKEAGQHLGHLSGTTLSSVAVRERIDRLERWAGVKLVEVTTRRATLTVAGQSLAERAVPVLAALRSLKEPPEPEPLAGAVRLAVAPALVEGWLAPRLTFLARVLPSVTIDLLSPEPDILLEAASPERLAHSALAPLTWRLVASPRYVAARGLPTDPAGFVDHVAVIHPDEGPGWSLSRVATTALVRPRATMVVPSYAGLLQLALAGAGIARLPALLADPPRQSGLLVPVLPDWVPTSTAISLRTASLRPSARVQAVLQALMSNEANL